MKIAITGAGGYIGSLLLRAHAARGDTVHALARDASKLPALPGVTGFAGDLSAPESLPAAFVDQADVLYHCAAELEREGEMHAVNVEGTRALLALAHGKVGHWVQVSSIAVYGKPRAGVVTEGTGIEPVDVYGTTKAAADALLAQQPQSAFTYTVLRPSGVIGLHMRNRSIHNLVSALDRGLFFFIGPPGATVNYVHEQNVVDALVLCATRREARQRIYNLSQDCAMEHVIRVLAEAIGREPPRVRLPENVARLAALLSRAVPGFPLSTGRVDALTSRVAYPATRIERELAFRPRTSIDEGLRELARQWKAGRE